MDVSGAAQEYCRDCDLYSWRFCMKCPGCKEVRWIRWLYFIHPHPGKEQTDPVTGKLMPINGEMRYPCDEVALSWVDGHHFMLWTRDPDDPDPGKSWFEKHEEPYGDTLFTSPRIVFEHQR